MLNVHLQLRSEARQFAFPISHDGHRSHKERWTNLRSTDLGSFVLQQSDQLNCLAQSHVVGKACTQSQSIKEDEPAESRQLIWTKNSAE